MKKPIAILIMLALLLCCCEKQHAFTDGRLEFAPSLTFDQGVIRVEGTTNLPDGFRLFITVKAAPEYLVEAAWSGETTIFSGRFSFSTVFTQPLPYEAAIILTKTINPEFTEYFPENDLPFQPGDEWTYQAIQGGGKQFTRTIMRVFGTPEGHAEILAPSIGELRHGLSSMEKEMKILDEMIDDPSYGYARFGRLHSEKTRSLLLSSNTTSFYYPDSFNDLKMLRRYVDNYFLLILAKHENDQTEIKRYEKTRGKLESKVGKIHRAIETIESAVKIVK